MRVLPCIILVALAACQTESAEQITEADRADIVAAIESQAQRWVDMASDLDPAPFAELVTPDVEVVDFMNHYVGVDAYLEGVSGLLGNFETWTSAWDQTNVEVLAPDAALFEGRLTLERQRPDGRRQASSPYVYMTAVYRLIDGEWKISRAHLSGSVRYVEDTE